MKNKKLTSREFMAALIRLNNIGQGKAADLAGVLRPNLSNWFTGRDNALSVEKKLKLFDVLGVSYGRLRVDHVHRWCVQEVEEAALVLGEVLDDEERTHSEFWHIHNSRYPGCIVLKVVKSTGSIWLMMYRPLMAEPPQPITAESLRCGIDRGDVIINNATWESWLPPAILEPESFGGQITKLIDQFPYPLPPLEYYEQMEDLEESNLPLESLEVVTNRFVPTPSELKKWDEVLFQAKLGGKSFDEIVKATRKTLGISILGRKQG